MKCIAVVTIVLLTATFCHAEDSFFDKHEVSIFASFYTKYLKGSEGLNERNNVLGISVDGYFASTFNNSHGHRSWLMGKVFSTRKFDLWDTGLYARANLYAGVLYGYGDDMPDVAGWTIGASPGLEVSHRRLEMGYGNLSIIILIAPFDGGVVTGLIGWTF